METTVRQLKRSDRDRVFGGVCGGLADYFAVDVVVVRVAYVALTLFSLGGGILLYFFAWLLIPLDVSTEVAPHPKDAHRHSGLRLLAGVFLIVAGILALGGTLLPWSFHWPHLRFLGPLFLMALGAALLIRMHDRGKGTPSVPLSGDAEATAASGETREIRRLMRSHRGRKLAGVCAGLGDYFKIDPTLVRLVWIILVLIYGTGILLYLILWIAMPLAKDQATSA